MPGLARQTADSAGGAQLNGGQSFVRVDGLKVVVVGDPVANHGSSPHAAATMIQGSTLLRIDGVAACRAGNAASCGHTTTGSNWVSVSA